GNGAGHCAAAEQERAAALGRSGLFFAHHRRHRRAVHCHHPDFSGSRLGARRSLMAWWGRNGRFQPYLLAFFLLLVAARPALAQSSRLPLDAYWDTLTQIRDELRAAGDDAAAVRQTAVATLTTITEI